MEKCFYFIRKITVPPVFAVLFLVTTYYVRPDYFGNIYQLVFGLIFLGILPVLGYPLQKYIPHFREKGREGQRTLAMIFSMAGYLAGTAVAYVCKVRSELKVTYFLYLLVGIVMFVFNKAFHLKASGHACGITAPVLLSVKFKMPVCAVVGLVLAFPVMVSSVKTKRHTVKQLIGGCIIVAGCLTAIEIYLFSK